MEMPVMHFRITVEEDSALLMWTMMPMAVTAVLKYLREHGGEYSL
jgi:hypothetical protein